MFLFRPSPYTYRTRAFIFRLQECQFYLTSHEFQSSYYEFFLNCFDSGLINIGYFVRAKALRDSTITNVTIIDETFSLLCVIDLSSIFAERYLMCCLFIFDFDLIILYIPRVEYQRLYYFILS